MDKQQIGHIRGIFAKLKIHPAHNQVQREQLMDLFGLYEEDLDVLHEFAMWVANHELEYAFELYNDHNAMRELIRRSK